VSAGNAGIEAAQAQLDLLKRGGSPSQKAQLQSAVDQAQAQVKAAQSRLEALKSGGIAAEKAELQAQQEQATSQLIAAQQDLKVAEARLAALQNGSQDAQLKSAASQVTAARERLNSDQARLDQLLAGPTDEEVRQATAAVDQAAQQLLLAQQPSTPQDIAAQQAAVEQARLQLQKARAPYTSADLEQQRQALAQSQAVLEGKQHPYTQQDLDSAQALVDQARAQVEMAQIGLKETQIVAPVDGVIAERLVSPGALVNPQTPIVTLVPPSLELVVNLDENQLAQVAEGQSVQLEVAGLPFSGQVKTIAPTLDSKSRTAAVRIEPKDETGKLRAGMFARLNIVTAARPNALVVPTSAVLNGSSVLTIDESNTIHAQPVQLGIQNDRFAEVLGGLQDGDLVATSSLSTLTEGQAVNPQGPAVVALAQ
jgi:RND family efflux transporter MFP subunit